MSNSISTSKGDMMCVEPHHRNREHIQTMRLCKPIPQIVAEFRRFSRPLYTPLPICVLEFTMGDPSLVDHERNTTRPTSLAMLGEFQRRVTEGACIRYTSQVNSFSPACTKGRFH